MGSGDTGSRTRRHMSVEFVVGSPPYSDGCFPGSFGFSTLLKLQHFQISIRSGIRGPQVCQLKNCLVSPSLSKVDFYLQ